MTWLTGHFIVGFITWACLAIGATAILLPITFLAACLITAAVGRLRRWPKRDPWAALVSPEDRKEIEAIFRDVVKGGDR